jgi:2-oxoglutarate dehydrogenase E2 component (dihydrolipoamide succinyltransferase)
VLKDFSTIVLYIMIIEIKIPSPGESISEVEIADWLVEDGSYVQKDQEIAEIESDKATLPLIAEKAGAVKILIEAGETAAVGVVACTIDTEADAPADLPEKKEEPKAEKSIPEAEQTATATSNSSEPVSGNNQTIKATPLARKLMEENNLNVDDIINGLRKITKSDVENVLHQASVVQAVPGKRTKPGSKPGKDVFAQTKSKRTACGC